MCAQTLPPDADTVIVPLSEGRSYTILVGRGLLENAGEHIAPLLVSRRVIIVTDVNVVAAGHLARLESGLQGQGVHHDSITLSPGEKTKNFSSLEKLLNQLLAFNPDRGTTLIALGGGVVGDITGFAASILLRGVPYIQIPTTLLAMVDSSVGGKTGINTKHGKNLVGTFYQPKLVLADLDTLATLPKREFLAGYAEVVKYGLINKPDFFTELEACHPDSTAKDNTFLQHCILTCCRAKAEIVGEDERESGRRALLNLGHTFGHALEAEMGYDGRLLHGEAVSIGMALAFQFSEQLGLCPTEDTQRVIAHLRAAGLPVTPGDLQHCFRVEALLASMYQDKKAEDGKLVLILTCGIGKAFIQKNIDAEMVKSFLISITPNR